MNPKVFISYSWTNQQHQELVKEWADRLIADGIDVTLDLYDLKEGHDKYAFMEKMVLDSTITHVLIISDKGYAEKADQRTKGVGTESQIISREVYEKVSQSKFIPIVCEFSDDGNPRLPAFLKSRIWIDFSSPEAVNQHWERLVRLLYGKPLHEKPQIGKTPAFLSDVASLPASPIRSKFNTLKQAISNGKPGISLHRNDFLGACYSYADSLRVRERPVLASLPNRIIEDYTKLSEVRNAIVDWVFLESGFSQTDEFAESLVDFIEQLRELRARPDEVNSWSETWFEAHRLFAYETFVYIVAALLKLKSFKCLNILFTSHYLLPKSERYGEEKFERFDNFYAYSEALKATLLSPEGHQYHSPGTELIRRNAARSDLPFADLIQADLLILLMSLITDGTKWYPQFMYYSRYGNEFPFFIRASQKRHFSNLAVITGISDVQTLRTAVETGCKRLGVSRWSNFRFEHNIINALNLEKLNTLN